MKIVISLESNRVMVSNTDWDRNPYLFNLKNGKEVDYNMMTPTIYINGFNAYIGEINSLIKYEKPSISIASNIFKNFGNPDYFYTESNGRKWNATLLTAVLIKRIIQKVEESVTSRISEVSFIVHPLLQNSEVQRELKTSLSYFNIEIGNLYNYSSALLASLSQKYQFAEGNTIILHADYYDTYIHLLHTANDVTIEKGFESFPQSTVFNIKQYITNSILEKAETVFQKKPSSNDKNTHTISEICEELYKSFFVKKQAEVSKSVFLDGKPCILVFNDSEYSKFKNEITYQLKTDIIKILDTAEIEYLAIDKILLCGQYTECYFVKETIESIFEEWKSRIIYEPEIIAKGGALIANNVIPITTIKKAKPSVVNSSTLASIIKLDLESTEEYIVFDFDSTAKHTSLTLNLATYERFLNENDEITFIHYSKSEETTIPVGKIIIKYRLNQFPSQLQLNILRSGNAFNENIQAIDIENDQVLNATYLSNVIAKPAPAVVSPATNASIKIPIKIGSKSGSGIKILAKGAEETVAKKPAITIQSEPKVAEINSDKKPKIVITPKVDKVKIEINSEDVKDKFQEILEILIINNTK
jgi:hypothetical protein